MSHTRIGTLGTRLAAVAAVLLLAGSSQANLLTNGSFELGVNPPGPPNDPFQVVSTGDNSTLTGWSVGGAVGVDWIHNSYWQASDGDYSLDLNALGIGSVSQSFATTAGATYSLTYDLSMNPDTNNTFPIPRVATVSATNTGDGSVLGQTDLNVPFNDFNSTFTDMNWTPYGLTFTATGDLTTVSFVSGNDYAGGIALDNVSVVATNVPDPTPIPAPAGLLLGLLGVGLAARFRHRKQAA